MHVFQPFSISKVDLNPYTISGEAGVCITTEIGDKINVQSSSNIALGRLWKKDMVFIFVRENTYTKELLDKSELFSVTFFEDKYKSSIKYLKSVSGRDEDKIEQIGFHINKKIDIPYIDEGNMVFLCDKLAAIPMDDSLADDAFLGQNIKNRQYPEGNFHYMFVGEILEVMAR